MTIVRTVTFQYQTVWDLNCIIAKGNCEVIQLEKCHVRESDSCVGKMSVWV